MQVTREDLNPATVRLTIVCDPDQVKQGFEKAFKQLSKTVRVAGFRPGHAPRAMLESMIPKSRLYDEAMESIINSSFKKAMEQEGLTTHGNPVVEDVTKLNHETNECEYSIKVPLKPIVVLGDYKGLRVERPLIDVTDEEVEQQIENMRRDKSTREAIVDRGIQEGDVAVLNIRIDGEEGEGRNFMTIAGQTFPQLDQAVMGLKAEAMKSADLTFPDSFQEKDWAGKTFHCTITVRSVSALKLPELDESFAQTLGTTNVDELKDRVRDGLRRYKEEQLEKYVEEQLLEELLQRSRVDVPDNMWEGVAAQRFEDIRQELAKQNKTIEQHAEEHGMTPKQLGEALNHEAETHVKRAVLVQEIKEREKIELTNTDLNDELLLMAREVNMKPEDLLAALKKNESLSELQHRAIFRKVTQFLKEHSNAQEVALA